MNNRHFYAGLLLAALTVSNVQAGFLSNSMGKIREVIRPQQIVQTISNHPKIALAAGIGVVGTSAAVYAIHRRWKKAPQSSIINNLAIKASYNRGLKEPSLFVESNTDNSMQTEIQETRNFFDNTWQTTDPTENPTLPIEPCLVPIDAYVQPHTDPFVQSCGDPFVQACLETRFIVQLDQNDYELNFPVHHTIDTSIEQVEIPLEPEAASLPEEEKWNYIPEYCECRIFRPEHVLDYRKIILLCPLLVTQCNNKLFEGYCSKLGEHLACILKQPVEVIFFPLWAHENNTEQAAYRLAELIRNRTQGVSPISLISISDASSCNLISQLADILNHPIDLGIHIGTLQTDHPQQRHFTRLFNLYAIDNLEGNMPETSQPLFTDNHHNIRIQINGESPKSGTELRKALTPENILALLFDINAHYINCDDLDACCFIPRSLPNAFECNVMYPMVALRRIPRAMPLYAQNYSNSKNAQFKDLYNRDISETAPSMPPLSVIGGQLSLRSHSWNIAAITPALNNTQRSLANDQPITLLQPEKIEEEEEEEFFDANEILDEEAEETAESQNNNNPEVKTWGKTLKHCLGALRFW